MKIKMKVGEDKNKNRSLVKSVLTLSPSDGDTGEVKERTEERITKGKGNLT